MSENNQLETEVGKDKVESSNETRGNAMRVFAGNVNRFNQYGSVRKFRAYCHDVALQVTSQSTDGIDSTAAFLCQRYSRETLKDMFPDLKRYGIAFDYGDADVVKIQKASEIINNRTKGKISKQMIIEIAKLVKSGNIKYSTERDIRTSDRFRIASGRCGVVSGEIKELVEDDRYGDFDVEMLHINMPSTPLKRTP